MGCNNVHVTCVEVDVTLMLRCFYGDVMWWDGVGWMKYKYICMYCISTVPYNDPIEHRNVLAVHYLNKKPGLEGVVKALARFRLLAMKSCRAPTLVFKEAPWDA